MNSREDLVEKLQEIGVDKHKSTIIALDTGSSQCVVDKVYLKEIGINKSILHIVYQLVVDFHVGDLT